MMRRSTYVYLFLIILIVIGLPGLIVNRGKRLPRSSDKQYYSEEETQKGPGDPGIVTLYINSSGEVEKIPLEEYVKGVVAAEMPGSFHMEALKAQAVAARTYVYKRLKVMGGSGCSLHPGADVCDDPSHCQAWINKRQMLSKWGIFSYYHYHSKIHQAVLGTQGEVIFYDNEPIDPVFFSTSNGKTENSEDVWENYVPYLRSVVSPGEETSPRFLSTKTIPLNEVVNRISQKWPDIHVNSANPESQWKVLERSAGGRVKTMQVGEKVIKGSEFRMLFGLNSADMRWERAGKNIKFTSTGFGHGVGMSQYGANAMAKDGAMYVDILKHYYTGVDVRKSDNF
jgi:stage II sporulation protein D